MYPADCHADFRGTFRAAQTLITRGPSEPVLDARRAPAPACELSALSELLCLSCRLRGRNRAGSHVEKQLASGPARNETGSEPATAAKPDREPSTTGPSRRGHVRRLTSTLVEILVWRHDPAPLR